MISLFDCTLLESSLARHFTLSRFIRHELKYEMKRRAKKKKSTYKRKKTFKNIEEALSSSIMMHGLVRRYYVKHKRKEIQ